MNTQLLTPTHTVNFARILPLFQTVQETAISPTRLVSQDLQLARLGSASRGSAQLQSSRPAAKARFEPLKSKDFSIPRASGVISRAAGIADVKTLGTTHMELPFGMPRFVNVATLKKMLKAKFSETLLKRVGDSWEICENSMKVDLADDSQEFRLGMIQIFS